MSFFKKLFGGGAAAAPLPEREYKGFTVRAEPVNEGGQFRLAGVISKEIAGVRKEHRFIRADLFSSKDEAVQFAFSKAELIIDQSGDSIFQ